MPVGGTKLGTSLVAIWAPFIQHVIAGCCLCRGSLPAQAGLYSVDRGQVRGGLGLQLGEAQTNSRLSPSKRDLPANEKLKQCSCVALVSTSEPQGTWVNFCSSVKPLLR